jgi:hypothetical protein
LSARLVLIAACTASIATATASAQTVRGTVVDSASGIPLRGARLTVGGQSINTTSDSSGAFTLRGLAAGQHTLAVRTVSLDSLGATYNVTLDIAGDSTSIAVRVPTALQVAAFACQQGLGTGGVLLGRLIARGDTAASRTGVVTAEWQAGSDSSKGKASPLWVSASSDERGRFALCGVPLDVELTLKAVTPRASGGPAAATVPAKARFGKAEVILDHATASAVFTGVVTLDTTREPIGGVEVSLPDLSRTTLTNERGTFILRDIPPGDQHVVVRRVGYGPVDTRLTFQAGSVVQRRFELIRATVLDSVVVTDKGSDRVMDDFERNRKLGLGHFLTRAELAKLEQLPMSSALRRLPGIKIDTWQTHAWILSSHANMGLDPRQWPNLDHTDSLKGAQREPCFALVYLDDHLMYRNRVTGRPPTFEPLFDVNTVLVSEVEAIEYYASPAEAPAKYASLDSPCGVLVIHTLRFHKQTKDTVPE